MSEQEVPGVPASGATASGLGAVRTAGQVLKAAREAAGLHVESVAMALKVPVHKLEALEADRHDLLPDMVFVRALASSLCRTLRMDPAEVLALLPQGNSPRLNQQPQGLNTPVKPGIGLPAASSLQKGPVWLILALLAGAALIWWLPGDLSDWPQRVLSRTPSASPVVPGANSSGTAVDAPSSAVPTSVAPEASSQSVEAAVSPATPAAVQPATAASDSAVSGATATAAAQGLTAGGTGGASASQPSVAMPADPAATGLVVFRARAASWVQVRDAAGSVVFQKTLAADETASVSGTPPLAVVVGRADATEVQVRGKPLSLDGLSRENVARFEVR